MGGDHASTDHKMSNVPKLKPVKKKRRDKSDLGDNFVAPDGGWGWCVSIASGINKVVAFALVQQFGIIFRDRFTQLDITNSQLTTIINIQIAVSAITGLLNGPLFRRFSFRQVAVFGSFITFIGLFATVFANSFLFYCLSFSLCYGFGRGLIVNASSLALNTYFKVKRRTATAYHYGVVGLGPIFLPYVATFFLDYFGVQGTVLLFAGLSLNTIACSLIYQPVKWHVKKLSKDSEASEKLTDPKEDDIIAGDLEIPVLASANDGWFGSKTSVNSLSPANRNRFRSCDKNQGDKKLVELKALNSQDFANERSFSLNCSIKNEHDLKAPVNKEQNNNKAFKTEAQLLIQIEKENISQLLKAKELEPTLIEEENERRRKLPWYMKVVVFFDFDLLRDFTYVNLALGLTLINFAELNFNILIPFILYDFGFESQQIALAMSLMGAFDLILRFLIPLITSISKLSNKAYFIWGILGMCIGRMFLSFTRNFYIMIAIFIWLGLSKALRTVFWGLIIPGCVPLKRLPAAAGLQLLMSGLFTLTCGPLIGVIRDKTSYAFALNFFNILCLLAIAGWVLEGFLFKYRNKLKPITED
ncbi:uncharacterized protein LOC119604943 [Lucilia sericata]|uniref:uncharacterized protein LOC119604943 n=1 Tax=Lucilia sericata TaxID=13632 RepID=UPI0018A8263E|nr:uncharacterized protein LOC119604943 [Lucilia sericata]XP_037813780.1 uncharacterized protein LOC119604943 [Lucilia sericata]XP_037813781.1 uncharacterized protein LOC119604943 [Lucilia sericata]XP_037813782.1 uncharacterized protein LOC119604943 [Lucilia sericata]XP_037813783.1 uncharacterized protein LOC119604943 [Lucilia sericata]XP_037813784.1 uncharacterized protein LOC119604943 [Lucilia sericata]